MLPVRFTKAFIGVVIALLLVASLLTFHAPAHSYFDAKTGRVFDEDGVEAEFAAHNSNGNNHNGIHNTHGKAIGKPGGQVNADVVGGVQHGGVIMPILGNATAKAALGRATWKLMHTMTLRFPEAPTQDERDALDAYFHLQARLYPCGECAAEFTKLLEKFPPQTSSRRSAALWLCHVHNQVNARLGKPDFDCAHLDEEYDCGCGDEPVGGSPPPSRNEQEAGSGKEHDDLTGADLIKGGRV